MFCSVALRPGILWGLVGMNECVWMCCMLALPGQDLRLFKCWDAFKEEESQSESRSTTIRDKANLDPQTAHALKKLACMWCWVLVVCSAAASMTLRQQPASSWAPEAVRQQLPIRGGKPNPKPKAAGGSSAKPKTAMKEAKQAMIIPSCMCMCMWPQAMSLASSSITECKGWPSKLNSNNVCNSQQQCVHMP